MTSRPQQADNTADADTPAGDTLLSRHDAVLLDLDGTAFRGSQPIEGAIETVERFRKEGVAVRFVTNNASRAPEAVAEHLRRIGFPADADEVETSAQSGAALLADLVPSGSVVLVVGTEALADEVRRVGMRVVRTVDPDPPAAVIQGHSPTTAWRDLAEACMAIREGATWVACNLDPTLPTERGELPGNGSMVAALRTATRRQPRVAGKPAPGQFQRAAATAGASRPLVIGDRLDTDIAGANAAGYDSLLVLSGVTAAHEVLAAPEDQRPGYIGETMAAVLEPSATLAVGPQDGWRIAVTADALEVSGEGSPVTLLRALCQPAWESGVTAVRVRGEGAARAARSLGLPGIDYR
jgi:HAD superfamily hydrolase (TIGR01450 family)